MVCIMFEDNDEDFDIDEEFLQDVFPSDARAEKRKSDENHKKNESSKKSRDEESEDFMSEELLKLTDSTQFHFNPVSHNQVDDEDSICDELLRLTDSNHNPLSTAGNKSTDNTLDDSVSEDLLRLTDSTQTYLSPMPTSTNHTKQNSFQDVTSRSLFTPVGGDRNSAKKSVNSAKRRFPGPAGLLPKQAGSSNDVSFLDLNETRVEKHTLPEVPLNSQNELTSSVAWLEAARSLQMKPGDASCPLGQFTVAWVRQRAAAKRLPQHKVPFLLVGVRHVEPSSRDPSVTLQDQTGEMHGILHRELWTEYAAMLVSGAVLALRQVGVLSTGPFARHQCLNVTANNVLAIFAPDSSQGTHTTHVKPVSRTQLLREIATPVSPVSSTPTPTPTQRLFSSIGTPSRGIRSPVSSVGSPMQSSTPKQPYRGLSNTRPHFSPKPSSSTSTSNASLQSNYNPQPPHTKTSINMSKPSQINSSMNHSDPSQRRINFPIQNSNAKSMVSERNGFEMAKLPIVNTRNIQVDRPPLNTLNRPNRTPKTSVFTPKQAVSSTQTPSQTSQAISCPLPVPAPPSKSVQQQADVQSLLEGINPEDLFDDF